MKHNPWRIRDQAMASRNFPGWGVDCAYSDLGNEKPQPCEQCGGQKWYKATVGTWVCQSCSELT